MLKFHMMNKIWLAVIQFMFRQTTGVMISQLVIEYFLDIKLHVKYNNLPLLLAHYYANL